MTHDNYYSFGHIISRSLNLEYPLVSVLSSILSAIAAQSAGHSTLLLSHLLMELPGLAKLFIHLLDTCPVKLPKFGHYSKADGCEPT